MHACSYREIWVATILHYRYPVWPFRSGSVRGRLRYDPRPAYASGHWPA